MVDDVVERSYQADVVPLKHAHVVNPEEAERRARTKAALKEYGRGKSIPYKAAKDKKLRTNLKRLEDKSVDAAVRAKDAEILQDYDTGFLEPETELERTYKVRQEDIAASIGLQTARNHLSLDLNDMGPYVSEYSRIGTTLLLGGRKGHVAKVDLESREASWELQLREVVRDVKWLHNDQYCAVAQAKHVYIYDHQGTEIHCLKKHVEPLMMTFLPHHFLLATVGSTGHLNYQDTSTGQMVADMPTKQGRPTAMAQNPRNAIVHIGHQNGQVSLWPPSSQTPLVKIYPHFGPVLSLAIDREGRYMVTSGQDKQLCVWDIRTYKKLNSYKTIQPGTSVAISDRDLTAVGWGSKVDIWRGLFDKALEDQEKQQSPYMSWGGEGKRPQRVTWRPFEDVLGISHDKGFSSIIVPGAGEANYDALEINPYETSKQRQEKEVRSLLDKLQPEMITLNPNAIGSLDVSTHEYRQKEKDLDRAPEDPIANLKNRGRGKNSSLRKHLRKKGSKNIVDEKRMKIDDLRKRTNAALSKKQNRAEERLGPALARFAKKTS